MVLYTKYDDLVGLDSVDHAVRKASQQESPDLSVEHRTHVLMVAEKSHGMVEIIKKGTAQVARLRRVVFESYKVFSLGRT